jgi:hypothetical protein
MMQRPLPTASAHHSPAIAILRVLALAVAASALNMTYYHGNTASSIQPYVSLPAPHVCRNAAENVRLFADTGRWQHRMEARRGRRSRRRDVRTRGHGPARARSHRRVAGEYTALMVLYRKDANGSAIIVNETDRANGAGFAHLLVWQHKSPRLRTSLVLLVCA